GHVPTEVPHELLLGPEGEPAYPGVQPVRADHNVEPPHGTAGERHLDAVPVVGQPGGLVAEQVLGSIAGGVVRIRVRLPRMISISATIPSPPNRSAGILAVHRPRPST